MDFIDWCHHVLDILESERLNDAIHFYRIPRVVLSRDLTEQEDFHNSDAFKGLDQTLNLLADAGLVDKDQAYFKISIFGRKVFSDPINFWSEICSEVLDSQEEKLLKTVNSLSPQLHETPNYGWLTEVGANDVCSAFEIQPPPFQTNEQIDNFQKLVYNLPNLLQQRNLLKAYAGGSYSTTIYPTYKGLVWELKRGITIESKLIDDLLKEWETTNVDFKREIKFDTKKQKAEFAKDVLGLATTKSSGKRYMIIGFDDKTRQYFAPPDNTINQNQMEQILSNLTEPVVNIRYEIVDYKLGKVGKLEVIREPEKLPYKAKQDVIIDEKKTLGLRKDNVYVRHGSQTEHPTPLELSALEEEGKQSRGEI